MGGRHTVDWCERLSEMDGWQTPVRRAEHALSHGQMDEICG